jgi:hypothetical protein
LAVFVFDDEIIEKRLLLKKRQHQNSPIGVQLLAILAGKYLSRKITGSIGIFGADGNREFFVRVEVIKKSYAQIPHVVLTLRSPRRLASGLNCRQQQRYQNANDSDDDQQLDQGETAGWPTP